MSDFPKIGWGFSKSGELLEKWPQDENGEPVPGALLTHRVSTDLDDVMTVNLLEAYGIPCIRRDMKGGAFGRIMLGISGYGTDLYVPETMLEDALALLSGESEDDDDNER